MTLVEKVAQAMYVAMAEVIERAYAEQHEPSPSEYFPVAIAALKAMREPGTDLVTFGQHYGNWALPSHFLSLWQAMIDQAIKEGESHES